MLYHRGRMTGPKLDPYAPPAADAAPVVAIPDVEEAFEATKVTTQVRVAAGLVAGTGLLLELSSVQLFGNFQLVGLARWVAIGMVALGAGVLFVAAKIYRQRVWAAQAGMALGIVNAVASALWLLLLFGSGVISLYAFALPPLSIAAAIVSRSALAQCRRASLARERLQGEGVVADF
jgi:hypothetical protein